ncbi:MAG TPA: hypothetical protein VL426_06025 [Candidatus Binatia bacterium]|jgi:hypothetical protein|nr:hypothetical protein [Candidatus Binatia bacterium]
MEKKTFIVSFGDIALRSLLVIAGMLAVPVPAGLFYFAVTDLSDSRLDDDGTFFWALGLFVASAVIYLVFMVPAIWRKRFISARRAA